MWLCASLVVVVVLASTLPLSDGKPSTTRPNPLVGALWNLEEMTECRLHHNALVYNNHGCWCGRGGCCTPVDPIDECCMLHDKCYDAAVDLHECYDVAWEYVDFYKWTCTNSTISCAAHGNGVCQAAMCHCDKTLVDCWAQYVVPAHKPACHHKRDSVDVLYMLKDKKTNVVSDVDDF